MITRRGALATTAAVAATGGPAWAAGAPPTLEALTRPPIIQDAALSPDGATIAILRGQGEDKKRVAFVDLIRAADPKATPARVFLGDLDVISVGWASNERLLVAVHVERDIDYTPTGSIMSRGIDTSFRRMLSVSLDGKQPVVMFGEEKRIIRADPNLTVVIDSLPDDPQHILMRAFDPRYLAYCLFKVDVLTGQPALVERGGQRTIDWETQNGRAVLRWDLGRRSTLHLMTRGEREDEWVLVRRVRRRTELTRPDFEIVANTPEPGVFLAMTSQPDDTAVSLRRFDVRTGQVGAMVAGRPDRDVESALIDERRAFVGARYTVDRDEYDFADRTLAPHFRGMDSFFRGEASVRIVDYDAGLKRLVVRASGPRTAEMYYLYDREAKRFEPIGRGRPWLNYDSLAGVEALDVKTRDGVMLRAYLTVPNVAGPRPLVVMPHGGPEVRDSLGFDVFAQVFAAQGWLVLQPNFRGSGGYGKAFANAGRRRWGDRMQEDVEDAVAQVIASGRADPKKVVICGASYGGYAAMMGAVRRPELYRCAVSIAGVFDLPEMLDYEKEDGDDSPSYRYWIDTIGDPATDGARLKAASPKHRAAEIKAPVLLIHGMDDDVVPFRQSRLMAGALKGAGKPFEHIELDDAGHGGWTTETLRRILAETTRFIGKHI